MAKNKGRYQEALATEITHHWKRVFVNRGELRLRHDGRLVLHRGTHEIGFDHLSSGEKVIALLATRLLIPSASTRASFLWFDEPLEHLDPSNRHLRSGGAGESHPCAPADPGVTVSRYPAPVILVTRRRGPVPNGRRAWGTGG